ncbi:MAG: hypothetical protein WA667_25455 [Candidatus Nitrosopolaris sp.]
MDIQCQKGYLDGYNKYCHLATNDKENNTITDCPVLNGMGYVVNGKIVTEAFVPSYKDGFEYGKADGLNGINDIGDDCANSDPCEAGYNA